jgi:hypothetical protein
MRAILLLLIIFVVPSYSQFNISLLAGISPPTDFIAKDRYDFVDLYWGSGITTALSSDLFISPVIAVSPSVEYTYYGFDRYKLEGVGIPEWYFKSSTGEASSVWRMFAEGKFFPNHRKDFKWYLSTGVGYVFERIGAFEITFGDLNGPDFTRTTQYQNKNFFVQTLGLGMRWSVFSLLELELKGQYITNYNDRRNTTAKIGVVYSIAD